MGKRILVSGYYGFRNTGDEAILQCLLNDLHRCSPDAHICVLSGDPESTHTRFGVDAIHYADIDRLISEAQKSDALIVGGGGIFQDYWGAPKETLLTYQQAGVPFYSSLPILGWLFEKPVLLYAVGVGPLFSPDAQELTRISFEIASHATVRDSASLHLLRSIGVKLKNLNITTDPTFALKPDQTRAWALLRNLPIDLDRPLIGICLRNWDVGVSIKNTWHSVLAQALDRFQSRTNCTYLFLPFQDLPAYSLTDDESIVQEVVQEMRNRSACVLLEYQPEPEVAAGILAACQLVVGMRYHSLLFSSLAGVPNIALAYDPKVSNLMQSLGQEEYILQLDNLNMEQIITKLDQAWQQGIVDRKKQSSAVTRLTRIVDGNYQAICRLFETTSSPRLSKSKNDLFLRQFATQQTLSLFHRDERIQALLTQIAQLESSHKQTEARINEKDAALRKLSDLIDNTQKEITVLKEELGHKGKQLEAITTIHSELEHRMTEVNRLSENLKAELHARESQLNEITRSRGWKLLQVLWGVRKTVLPQDSWLLRVLKALRYKRHDKKAMRLFQPPRPFHERYHEEDNSLVTVYTDNPRLFPDYVPRRALHCERPDSLKLSLIVSVMNESGNVNQWIKSIEGQSRLPDEVVIVDGGSADGTDRLLEEWGKHSQIPVRLVRAPGANIAQSRNRAMQESRFPILAVTDFGCEPKPDWLEKLIRPFIHEPDLVVSSGFYECINCKGEILSGNGLWLNPGQVNPQDFLPSSRSVAFRKDAVEAVGGHPEMLTKTGDDTYLDLELKRLGGKWAFVPEAQVKWVAPVGLFAYLKKMYLWAIGDGESGVHARYYWRYLLRCCLWSAYTLLLLTGAVIPVILNISTAWLWVMGCLGLWIIPIAVIALRVKEKPAVLATKALGEAAQVLGFLKGSGRMEVIAQRRLASTTGTYLILSGVPIDDTGGGARGTQFALELLRQGYAVLFIHKFPKAESRNLKLQFSHPNLFLSSIDDFRLDLFDKTHPGLLHNRPVITMLEFPLHEFMPLVQDLIKRFDTTVVYDLLDDWQTALGGEWYSREVENKIIQSSHLLVATLPRLADYVKSVSGRDCLLLPNAVNERLFDPKQDYVFPHDLPSGKRIMIYVGALWGEWMDWDLLQETARQHPDDNLVVIGDYRGQCQKPPLNLHFLGLKPQTSLPAYLSHADLALIPWKVGAITQATSPLKVYEYLAMQLPVLAPNLESLRTIPGVTLAGTPHEFVHLAGCLNREDLDPDALEAFIQKNTWHERVCDLNRQITINRKQSNAQGENRAI